MSGWKKLASAAAASGEALNVEDVFSTYLYEGTGTTNSSTQNITNNIDLSTEGGLVWIKDRGTKDHFLFDTERGATKYIRSNNTDAESSPQEDDLSAFLTDGFTVRGDNNTNENGVDYASWTFRKAPKFFDIVTYTGNGTAGRTVSHNLGSVPGCIIVKATSSAQSWAVYHRGVASDAETDYLVLNDTNAAVDNALYWNDTAPTASNFTVGTRNNVNGNGITYVAYLFAHNDDDGEFGPTGDQDIIKCGSYTGNGSYSAGPEIDLGFEPQWLLVKSSTLGVYWSIYDNMRGLPVGGDDARLYPNTDEAESTAFGALVNLLPNGFQPSTGSNQINQNGETYIYMAIRRGPMAVPESATDVFDVTQGVNSIPAFDTGFTVDLALQAANITSSTSWRIRNRLTNANYLRPDDSATEVSSTSGTYQFDLQTGYGQATNLTNVYAWLWKRAPNFFDVVAYTGDQVAGRTVSHNLGVVPEMIITKRRSTTGSWVTYHKDIGNTGAVYLDSSTATVTTSSFWNDTSPTASSFSVGTGVTNTSGASIIAYLFASLDGVSKVGSYTGTGAQQTIDCGFTSGARFILTKRTDSLSNWIVCDTERGIVSGNDPFLALDATSAEGSQDIFDPNSVGFEVTSNSNANTSGATYIYYAIA